MQETWVQSLVREEPTCCGAIKPCAAATELMHNYRSPQAPCCAPQEKPPQRQVQAPQQESSLRSLQSEKAHAQQWRPSRAKNKLINLKKINLTGSEEGIGGIDNLQLAGLWPDKQAGLSTEGSRGGWWAQGWGQGSLVGLSPYPGRSDANSRYPVTEPNWIVGDPAGVHRKLENGLLGRKKPTHLVTARNMYDCCVQSKTEERFFLYRVLPSFFQY